MTPTEYARFTATVAAMVRENDLARLVADYSHIDHGKVAA